MTELQLSTQWRDAVERAAKRSGSYIKIVRIESGITHIGIPDCYIILDNTHTWVELKKIKDGTVEFRPGQRSFIRSINAHGGHAICVGLWDGHKLCSLIDLKSATPGVAVTYERSLEWLGGYCDRPRRTNGVQHNATYSS